MTTEIQHIDARSVLRVAVPLGAVGGALGLLPFVFEMMAARTPGRFLLDGVLFVSATAIVTAVVAATGVLVYNTVSEYVGGIEVTLGE